ncbi:hypothetical protein PGB90_003499 [Kerria lacca]
MLMAFRLCVCISFVSNQRKFRKHGRRAKQEKSVCNGYGYGSVYHGEKKRNNLRRMEKKN